MRISRTEIAGCYELFPNVFKDERGVFVKTFHREVFKENGLDVDFAEEYYSISKKNVLRGLHFQFPPMEHTKMVYCTEGTVMDAVVDLRVGSPTYLRHLTFELSAEKANIIYIPPGLAHGFYVLSEYATVHYKVTSVYSPQHDSGILWSSAGIPWPGSSPLISKRDSEFLSLSEFTSPFRFKENHL